MRFSLLSLCIFFTFLLPFISFTISSAEFGGQFNCPNGGEPKMDERTGKPLQCLPGRRSSSAICGFGHACFFSGFNYQCCPSLSDDEEDDGDNMMKQLIDDEDGKRETESEEGQMIEEECPEGSFSVLNSEGTAMGCGQLGTKRECFEPKMFCYTGATMKLCCERFENEKSPPIQSHLTTQVSGEVTISNSGEKQRTEKRTKSGQKDDGQRVKSQKELARKSSAQIQSVGTMKKESKSNYPALTHKTTADPNETDIPQQEESVSAFSVDEPPLQIPSTQQMVKMENIVAKNERAPGKDYAEGKALKETIDKEREDAEERRSQKAFQQYFLEKINDGWPYDDKFYRPTNNEDIFVVKKRNRPMAIVHFPN
ncbi:hypothetical protein niasHS_007485 [Heterodera schachtii]|uniref:Uncharacterized protein n=1 Tax=Heterodera schachtii TaxID=97005 RepID=A0ABD2JXM2_HETSC